MSLIQITLILQPEEMALPPKKTPLLEHSTHLSNPSAGDDAIQKPSKMRKLMNQRNTPGCWGLSHQTVNPNLRTLELQSQ